MRIVSYAEAKLRFPEAIEKLEKMHDFLPPGSDIMDEHDRLVQVGDESDRSLTLVIANVLDEFADIWDDKRGEWMGFEVEDFFAQLKRLENEP